MHFPSEYVIYDFETTGFLPDDPEVIEIGAMHVRDGEVIDKGGWLIKIGTLLPEKIVQLTGITDDLLAKEGIPEEEAFRAFAKMAHGKVLMGHNILRYDNILLLKYAQKYGLMESFEYGMVNCIDTAGMFKAKQLGRKHLSIQDFWLRVMNEVIRGQFNLGYAHELLGCNKEGIVAHRAGGDVEMVKAIYEKMAARS